MKMLTHFVAALVMIFVLSITHQTVSATSWAQLETEEIIERADVIVKGTYDFSSNPVKGEDVFTGYEFQVNKVFKGKAEELMVVGIDEYDKGWVNTFQEDGGAFLLFLEESDKHDFLVPVAGPNGMIQVSEKLTGNHLFNQILREEGEMPTPVEKEKPGVLIYTLSLLSGIAVVGFTAYRVTKRKREL